MTDFLKRFWFELITPPVRRRVEGRHMSASCIAADSEAVERRDQQFQDYNPD